MWVPDRDTEWVRQFDRRLDPAADGAWSGGLDLARRAGPAVGPLLRRMQERASDHRERVLVLGAVVAAEGPAAVDLLIERVRPRRRSAAQVRERLAAAYLAHHLPATVRDPKQWLPVLLDRGEEPAVRISAAFAVGRTDHSAEAPRRLEAVEDPGIAAGFALVFDGLDQPWSARWFGGTEDHEPLVQRAMFLGADSAEFTERRVRRVSEAVRAGGDAGRPLRLAAALSLLGCPQPERWLDTLGDALDEEMLAVLALDPGFGPLLADAGRLSLLPDRVAASLRSRMALALALRIDAPGLRRLRDGLRRDTVAGPVVCLGLASRLLRTPELPELAIAEAWGSALPALPEAEWVRIACGLPLSAERPSFPDRELDRAYRKFVARGAQGLPRDAQRAAVDAALHGARAVSGALRRELEQELLWDLVLRGSDHGIGVGARGAVTGEEYLAGGLAPGDGSYQVLGALDVWFRRHPIR